MVKGGHNGNVSGSDNESGSGDKRSNVMSVQQEQVQQWLREQQWQAQQWL